MVSKLGVSGLGEIMVAEIDTPEKFNCIRGWFCCLWQRSTQLCLPGITLLGRQWWQAPLNCYHCLHSAICWYARNSSFLCRFFLSHHPFFLQYVSRVQKDSCDDSSTSNKVLPLDRHSSVYSTNCIHCKGQTSHFKCMLNRKSFSDMRHNHRWHWPSSSG